MNIKNNLEKFEEEDYNSLAFEYFSEDERNMFSILAAIRILKETIPENQPVHIDLEYDDMEYYHYFTIHIEKTLDNYERLKYLIEDNFNHIIISEDVKKEIFSNFEPFTFFNNESGIDLLKRELLGKNKYSLYIAAKLDLELNENNINQHKVKI